MERVFLDFFLFNIFLLIKETLLLQDLLDTKFVISILEFCFKLDNIFFFFLLSSIKLLKFRYSW